MTIKKSPSLLLMALHVRHKGLMAGDVGGNGRYKQSTGGGGELIGVHRSVYTLLGLCQHVYMAGHNRGKCTLCGLCVNGGRGG